MGQTELTEGLPAELSGALIDGYRSILEGVGDARKADTLYGYFLPLIFQDIYSKESLNRLYRFINSRDGQYVVVSTRDEFKSPESGQPLVVRFTRSNCHPSYNEQLNVIEVPIMPFLAHAQYGLIYGKTRDNPLYLKVPMPFNEMCRQLSKAWKENTAGSFDTACLRDTILHEFTHWYDYRLKRNTIINPDKKRPVYPNNAAGEYAEWTDENFPQYRSSRFTGDDAGMLQVPDWVNPDVMRKVKRIRRQIAENISRKNRGLAEIPLSEEDDAYIDWFRKMSNRHKAKGYHANTAELSARIVEQVPWLIELKDKADAKGEKIPVHPTLEQMLDRVFDIHPDGPGFMHDKHELTKTLVLPGAYRSAARRCFKLINAANEAIFLADYDYRKKVGQILGAMQREASPQHAGMKI